MPGYDDYAQQRQQTAGRQQQAQRPDGQPMTGLYDPNGSYRPQQTGASGGSNPNYQQIEKTYQGLLGRSGSPSEYESHMVYQNGVRQVDPDLQKNIYNSPEAAAYRTRQASQQTEPSAPPAEQQSSGNSGGGGATGSPVSATGGIPPPQQTPAPTPATRGQEPNETRYVQPADLSKAPAYQPTQFNQQAPNADPGGFNGQQNALMTAILQNPGTMNPNVVAQMKEAQKEQALLMQNQNQQNLDSMGAARGTLGSGFNLAQNQNLANQAQNQILTGNRATDIQAAQTNRADQLNALQASDALGQSQFGRQLQGAQFGLGQQQAQAGENQYANQDSINRILQQFGINQGVAQNAQQNYGQDFSNWLAKSGLGLDIQKFLENQRQYNGQMGYNYDALDQNGQMSQLDWLQRMAGN